VEAFGDGGASMLVARLLDGEGMSEVSRDFGISRKTGCNIFSRYKDQGLDRRPERYANQLPDQGGAADRRSQAYKPHWGARKIRVHGPILATPELPRDNRLPPTDRRIRRGDNAVV
jgi:Homeodomain-like domain